MEWVETTGKTIEEAKDAALDQLGVDEADAEFEVLEEPKSGLFGRLRQEARIRARVRPTQPRAKAERRDRSRSRGRRGNGRGDAAPPRDPPRRDSPRPKKQRRPEQDAAPKGAPTMTEELSADAEAAIVQTFLDGLVDAFALSATASTEIVEGAVEARIEGDDLGMLIGPRGQTLSALQELVRTVVQRHAVGARHGRVNLDVSGYRERRRAALERFTEQIAEEVRSSGRQRALEPMGPADRKIVHDTVNELDGVATVSEGEEPRRRVVIVPVEPSD